MKLTLAATLALGILATAVPAIAQVTTVKTPMNANPAMTGSAGPSKEVKSEALFSYPVTATDKDTWNVVVTG
jgi:hypothetical protein